ncbi:amidohydrolase [Streptomyces sp. NPDC060065]|uniref:amidohydrolase n=1 Tax=Streptomyces sp. NPDC060065 TaxID=3347050 RepID=UPI00367F25E9
MPIRKSFADLVFTGGPVHRVNAARSRATAVAVSDGRIVAVGHDKDVRDLIGSRTEVVDLAGRLLLPGFHDAHVHPVLAGVAMLQCALQGLTTAGEYLDAVHTYALAHPERPWVTGAGWSMEAFPGGTPHKALLDTVLTDRPVLLINRDGHGAWANSKALALAGITRDTPDPADGRIERDGDGEPTGMLQEGAVALISALQPDKTPEELAAGLLTAQRHLHSLGITGWQDAGIGPGFHGDLYRTYLDAAVSGELTARVVGAHWWDRAGGADQIKLFEERRAEAVVGRFRATTVKMMLDGIAENFTAAMLEPYLDGCGCPGPSSGLDFIDPALLAGYVTELDAAGFQVHFHSLGDRAVRLALDAVAQARRDNGPTDGRHHLAHIQVVHPDDLPRFRELGAAANLQALWARHEPQMDDLTIPYLGERRAGWQYPFGSLQRAGAMLVAGSDWPVSSADPLAAVHTAVNRTVPGSGGAPPFLPGERISLDAAIAAYTSGSTWVNHLDAVAGSIDPGKYADLVVLDRDPFAGPPDEIAATSVLRTYVEGQLVHATA